MQAGIAALLLVTDVDAGIIDGDLPDVDIDGKVAAAVCGAFPRRAVQQPVALTVAVNNPVDVQIVGDKFLHIQPASHQGGRIQF